MFKRSLGSLIVFTMFGAGTMNAQQTSPQQPVQQQQSVQTIEVSDRELESFLAVNTAVETINQELQQEMVAAVQDEGLDPQRYVEINQQQQSGQEPTTQEGEMTKFQSAQEKVAQIQQKGQQQVDQKIKEENMTTDRYREVYQAVQQDPALQQKLQELQR